MAVGDRDTAYTAQDKHHEREIDGIGYQVTHRRAIHSIERDEVVIQADRGGSEEEREEEREDIEAGVTERRETNGESGNNDLVNTKDQHHILRDNIGAAVGQEMENKVDIEPYSEENESADEEEVVTDLVYQA